MNIREIIEIIRQCFETRNFTPMVNLFAKDGVYETPYALDGSLIKSNGIDAIKKRFERVSESSWNKAVTIDTVTVETISLMESNSAVARFFISGKRNKDGAAFNFPSSVAIITIKDGRIVHYCDYPNLLGISKAAGLLMQLAGTLTDD